MKGNNSGNTSSRLAPAHHQFVEGSGEVDRSPEEVEQQYKKIITTKTLLKVTPLFRVVSTVIFDFT